MNYEELHQAVPKVSSSLTLCGIPRWNMKQKREQSKKRDTKQKRRTGNESR